MEIETCINYCEPPWAFLSSNERRWVNHILRLCEAHPDDVIILKHPDANDGFIYAKFPIKWAKVTPQRKCTMTDEDKAKLAENLRLYRKSKRIE